MSKLPSLLSHASVVAYTKRLSSHVKQGYYLEALHLFHHLHSSFLPLDSFVLSLTIKSATSLSYRPLVLSLHSSSIKSAFLSTPYVSSSLIDFYGKCISLRTAHKLFDEILHRNAVVWNTIISVYSVSGDVGTAIKVFNLMDMAPSASCFNSIIVGLDRSGASFERSVYYAREMQRRGLKPNLITLLGLLSGVASAASINLVKEIHGFALRNSIHPHVQLSSSLVESYGRCGSLLASKKIFDELLHRDVVAWSSLVSAYALNGDASGAMLAFQQMEESGIRPDAISLLEVMKACSHAGLVEEAKIWFTGMTSNYGIHPGIDHYACMVDILGRAGKLDEAYTLIREMPMVAGAKVWGALLNACRTHGDVEIAEIAGGKLFEIEPGNAGNFVMLSTIYTRAVCSRRQRR